MTTTIGVSGALALPGLLLPSTHRPLDLHPTPEHRASCERAAHPWRVGLLPELARCHLRRKLLLRALEELGEHWRVPLYREDDPQITKGGSIGAGTPADLRPEFPMVSGGEGAEEAR